MPELPGYKMEVRISATEMSDGGDGYKIEGLDNATLNRLADILEITQFGNTYKKRMSGLKDSNVSLSGNYRPDDTNGQLSLEPGGDVYIAMFPQGTTAAGRQIKMIVENFEHASAADGKQTFSATVQGNGEPAAISAAS